MATKATKPGTAVILWEEEMKASAVKQAAAEKTFDGVKRIQIRSGFLMIDNELVEGNSLDVVVIAAVHLNEYYSSAYDANKPTVPTCYAFGDETLEDPEASMAPSDDVEDKQGDDNGLCANCWANQMGTADTGRGKACKNGRRLLVITEDALESPKALAEAEERSLGIPVMSVKGWAKYLKEVLADQLKRPYYGVVTTIGVVPDPKSQFRVTFAFKELINFDAPLWEAMKLKTAAAAKTIVAPYPKQADLDAANAKPAAKVPGKPAGKGTPVKTGKAPAPAAKKSAKY